MNCSNILRPFGLGQRVRTVMEGWSKKRKREEDVCVKTETQKGNKKTGRHMSWHSERPRIQSQRQTEEGEWYLGNILRKVDRCGRIPTAGQECADRPRLGKHLHLMHRAHTYTHFHAQLFVLPRYWWAAGCFLVPSYFVTSINKRFPLTNMLKMLF